MLHVRRQQSSRLYATVEPIALLLSTTTPTKSSDWRGKQRESRRYSGQSCIPMGARVVAAQTGVDTTAVLPAVATESMEIMASTGGMALPPRISTMVAMGPRPLLGTSVPAVGDLPSPRPTTSIRLR
jgi:hypothetical protein